jgi:Fic family protein
MTRFDHQAASLTNTEVLARLLLRAESVASSRIEGLVASPQRLLRAAVTKDEGTPPRDELATEVLANIDAMAYAIEGTGPVTIDRIREVHRRLMATTRHNATAGVIRTEQNWIGGSGFNPIDADFVPPPHEAIDELLADLCEFCNDDGLPAVAQAAIAHAQFETIHPFVDGNGRTGRALIYMVLRRRGLAVRATPPISLVLATRSKDYIRRLDATRTTEAPTSAVALDAFNSWIAFFAACCVRAVADAQTFEQRIATIQAGWSARLGSLRADASARRLVEVLPALPVVTVTRAARAIGRQFAAANEAIADLVSLDILSPVTAGRRNRAFEAREIIDAFTALERQLASPSGDTKISKRVRKVPPRRRI